jgi:hypothetical protein
MSPKLIPSIARLVLYLALASVIATFYKALSPSFIADGLDPSWRAALLFARSLHLSFGDQIIFTTGPLSHAYEMTFSSNFHHEKVLSILLITLFYTLFIVKLANESRNVLVACIAALPFFVSIFSDPAFIGLPFCASLLGTLAVQRAQVRALVALGAVASAMATLAKFSIFPMAAAGFLVVDTLAISKKRFPLALAIYGLAMAGILAVISPETSLLTWLRASTEAASGYTEAMSISGPTWEVVLVPAIMLALVGVVTRNEMRRFQTGESPLLAAVARVAIVAVFLWVCTKGGLVRHDLHVLMAWYGLGFGAAAYCAFSWRALSRPLAFACLALTAVGLVGICVRTITEIRIPARTLISDMIAQRKTEYLNWAAFLARPGLWLSEQEAQEHAAAERLRSARPLPKLQGTVDTIPSIQSALIANGLQYWPRPVFQEYVTYTHGLVERNRAFFQSDRAPKYILMAPEAIDARHPATAEGAIWPDLLARYAPRDIVAGAALLEKRERPIDLKMQSLPTLLATMNSPVDLAALPSKTIFAHIDVQPTFLGKLANLVLKSAALHIDVQYVDGTDVRYRFIPAMGREGFFLSPLVANAENYISLATGKAGSNPQKVKSFVIQAGTLARWLWSQSFTVRLDVLDDNTLVAAEEKKQPSREMRRKLDLVSIQNANPGVKVALITFGMLAHAPTALNVPAAGHRTLDIGFGLLDEAWKGDANTDGVCFRLSAGGSISPLWQRCLDPKQVTTDRGEQRAEIALPENVTFLTLETLCGKSCAWDWSYWGEISLR